jgi:hypothetical protein
LSQRHRRLMMLQLPLLRALALHRRRTLRRMRAVARPSLKTLHRGGTLGQNLNPPPLLQSLQHSPWQRHRLRSAASDAHHAQELQLPETTANET